MHKNLRHSLTLKGKITIEKVSELLRSVILQSGHKNYLSKAGLVCLFKAPFT